MNFNDLNYTIIAQSDGGDGGPPAQPGQGPKQDAPGLGSMMPLFIGMFVIMYFVMIRPQRKKQKAMQLMIDNMRVGDSVVSAGGIHGIITNKTDTTVTVRVAQNTKMKFEKASIGKVTPKDRPLADEDDDEEIPDDEDQLEEEEEARPKAKKKASGKRASSKKRASKKAAKKSPVSLRSETKEFDRSGTGDSDVTDSDDSDDTDPDTDTEEEDDQREDSRG
ncbi:MAG: preprotein translocase subunit YajC [Verrucomicrobiales bacterium]|jgi:preprotein translocase subunit YajC